MTRERDFNKIKALINDYIRYSSNKAIVAGGDSLKLLKLFPDHSISLILTDPPYHVTQKKNIFGDTTFKNDIQYLNWMKEYFDEWHRVLRPNGSLFLFCASALAGRLEVQLSQSFNILSNLVWTKPNDPGFDGWKQKMRKEALRQWYSHTERIIFAEPAEEGNLNRTSFANFLKNIRIKVGLSTYQLTEMIGAYGKVNHGGAVSNWEAGRNIPNRQQYNKLCDAIISTGKIKTMPQYEDIIRPFMVNSTKEFTDVWNFPSVKPYKGKHPAEKPIDLLRHAVEATSYPGDIVLDCFGGSGNTLIAALLCARKSIAIEIETKWVDSIIDKIKPLEHIDISQLQKNVPFALKEANQLALFTV